MVLIQTVSARQVIPLWDEIRFLPYPRVPWGQSADARRGQSRAGRGARDHRGMTVHASRLDHAYHGRRGAFVSEERLGDWRLKLYGLAAPERGVRPALLERTRALAARSLPPVDDAHHGAAFAIAHDASFPIALDLLVAGRERAARADLRRRGDRRARTRAGDRAGLRLGARDRRVRAPRLDRDVIGNPDGPDLAALPRPPLRRHDLAGGSRRAGRRLRRRHGDPRPQREDRGARRAARARRARGGRAGRQLALRRAHPAPDRRRLGAAARRAGDASRSPARRR